uniref:Uncharacterized protein n=1 Tax=Arundo donax TaxID=35708 RepID=A0A0A9BG68_ARUDO
MACAASGFSTIHTRKVRSPSRKKNSQVLTFCLSGAVTSPALVLSLAQLLGSGGLFGLLSPWRLFLESTTSLN